MTSSPSTRPRIDATAVAVSCALPCMLPSSRCIPASCATRSMPRMISEKNSPKRSGRMTPTVSVLRRVRLRAPLCGTKLSFLTAAITAARVGAVTLPSPLIARDAVATDTPASRATSLSVAIGTSPSLRGPPCQRAAARIEQMQPVGGQRERHGVALAQLPIVAALPRDRLAAVAARVMHRRKSPEPLDETDSEGKAAWRLGDGNILGTDADRERHAGLERLGER